MLTILKEFFLNISIILFPVFMYPFFHRTDNRLVYNRTLYFFFFSLAIVFAMSLPINIHGLIFDFRAIPLTIGSLYGGFHVSCALYAVLLLFRYLQNNPNQLVYAVSLLPTLLIVYIYIRRYMALGLRHKMIAAATLFLAIRVFSLVSYTALNDGIASLIDAKYVSTFFIMVFQSVVCALYVLLFERLRSVLYIQQEVINSEKIKIVSDIAASVAHEIRNPLTSVRGFIQLLGEERLDEGKRGFYEKICLEELDRAQLIISDYLTLAKPGLETNEPIEIGAEIGYIRNILLSYANYQNVEIVCGVEDEPLWIAGDKYKFRQALINIGKNAIEAMKGEGVLDISVSEHNGRIAIQISDTGVGMTADQIARLGTPYYSTKEKGTGLGTMVSFSIIKNMNGTIRVQSKVGKGTKYVLSFPRAEAPAQTAAGADGG
ncbi:ATP-binding protein [Paenibacillus sp. GYB003]|uniref:ATP-binding protein n=1 Tax=Paenibacillus sp. GYB003 TaxID=2994392 RepID=UPI002F96D98B